MFLLLSKVLTPLLLPPGLQMVLVLISFFLFRRRPKLAWTMGLLSIVSLAYLSSGVAVEAFTGHLERQFPSVAPSEAPTADAIIVLGDFQATPTAKRPRIGIVDDTDRLYNGVQLFRAGKAPVLVLSGGSVMLYGSTRRSQAEYARDLAISLGVPASSVLVEGLSQNTHENAVASRNLLAPRNIHRVLLVTSGYHMPRSAAIFRKEGFDVIPYPADFKTGWYEQRFPFGYLPNPQCLFVNGLALHEYIGLAVYKLRGWA